MWKAGLPAETKSKWTTEQKHSTVVEITVKIVGRQKQKENGNSLETLLTVSVWRFLFRNSSRPTPPVFPPLKGSEQGQHLEAMTMAQHLTICPTIFYNVFANKTRLFLTTSNRIVCLYIHTPTSVCGMYSSWLQGVHAVRPKSLWDYLKWKLLSVGPVVFLKALEYVHDGTQCQLLTEKQKAIVKVLKAQVQSQKAQENANYF